MTVFSGGVATGRLWSDSLSWPGAALVAEVLAVDFLQIPSRLGFDGVAFGDYGFNITVQSLISRGYRPGFEFGYPYGSLSLLFGKLWFSALGATPAAFYAATVVCDLLFVLGLVTFLRQARIPLCGFALAMVSVPFSVIMDITFAHCFERVLLCWALAQQANGRKANALALATGAVFTKPAMGFVYGGLLLFSIIWKLRAQCELKIRRLARELRPAAMLGSFLFVILSLVYSAPVVLRLLLPSTGAEIYRLNRFGFFGETGRAFWYFPGVHVGYYIGTPVTFWFFASACLLLGGCCAAIRIARNSSEQTRSVALNEVVLSCALMHFAFVMFFFGSNASWASYVYILAIGVVGMTQWPGNAARAAWVLTALGVAGQKGALVDDLYSRVYTAPSATTAGLWVSDDERQEWKEALEYLKGGSAVVLAGDGAVQSLFSQFHPPVVASLIRGQTTEGELHREFHVLSEAHSAVVPEVPNSSHFLDSWPEFGRALHGWSVVFRGRFFTVYRHPNGTTVYDSVKERERDYE